MKPRGARAYTMSVWSADGEEKPQPRYIPGTVGSATCIALEFVTIALWRTVLVLRNKRRDRKMREQRQEEGADPLTEEEMAARGKELGQQDYTDFENPYVSFPLLSFHATPSFFASPLFGGVFGLG